MLMDSSAGGGFEGAVGGMPLSDVVQLKAYNRFTGTLTVEYDGQTGIIYFRNGEIVHAEVGTILGEHAFYAMIRWPGGRFSAQNGVAAPVRTIENSVSYLLLEAHRLMDEENNPDATRNDTPGEPPPKRAPGIVDRVAALKGVRSVVLLNEEGKTIASAGDGVDVLTRTAEKLAGLAHSLAERFGTGTFLSGVFQGGGTQALLFESRRTVMAVGLLPDATAMQIEADIRAEISRR